LQLLELLKTKVRDVLTFNILALSELVPGILTQLGQDSLQSLRKLAETYENAKAPAGEAKDDEIPDLVENFEEEAKK
jgi:nascent polypeptide-associated complex subunit beta